MDEHTQAHKRTIKKREKVITNNKQEHNLFHDLFLSLLFKYIYNNLFFK